VRGAAVLRRVAPQAAGVLVVIDLAVAWAWYGGSTTARLLRRAFGVFDPVVVLAIAGALVAAGAGLRVFGVAGRRWTGPSPVPTAIWLAAIASTAALFRVVLGRANHLPKVFGDELIYAGLAKGWAVHGQPVLRGDVEIGYSTLYPLFLAPAFRLAGDAAHALEAVKAMNAIAFALAAVPAYLLARRALPRGWALGVAALSALAPWGVYSALVLTESLFYPVFVACAATLAWTLERPTWRRQLTLLALLAVLVGVRTQGLAVVAGALLAILLCGGVRRFLPTLAVLAALAVFGVAASLAGLALPTATYNPVFDSVSRIGAMLEWGAWNLAAFQLSLGVVALAAFPLGLRTMLRRAAPPGVRATGTAALGLGLGLLGSVALLSASPYGLDRLHERSLFFATPLLLTCLAYWLWRGLERPRWLALGCALAVLGLAATLPRHVVLPAFDVDYPTAPFFAALDAQVPSVPFRIWMLAIAGGGAGTLLLARGPLFPVLTVVLAFAAVTAHVDYTDTLTAAQARALSWVDYSLPDGAGATLVHLGVPYSIEPCASTAWWEEQHLVVWTEWFNTRVDAVTFLYEPNHFDGLYSHQLAVGDRGLLLNGGRPLRPEYVVVDSRQPLAGTPLVRFDLPAVVSQYGNGASLTLWRVDQPLRIHDRPFPLPPRGDGRGC
jgi:hypothetical protein